MLLFLDSHTILDFIDLFMLILFLVILLVHQLAFIFFFFIHLILICALCGIFACAFFPLCTCLVEFLYSEQNGIV